MTGLWVENRLNLKAVELLNYLIIEKGYSVLTLHRAENTGDNTKLKELIDFIRDVSSGSKIVFPVHPQTNKVLQDNIKAIPDNIRLIEPLSYFDMLWLVKNSRLLLTDSGGLQKEAYWLKVPCITLREQTKLCKVAGTSFIEIINAYTVYHPLHLTSFMVMGKRLREL